MILYKIQDSILMSPAKRDKVVLANLIFSVLINIAIWVVLFFVFNEFSDYIILKYNIYFGISSFGPWYNILIVPMLGLFFLVVNFLVGFYLYLKEKALSYFLAFSASIVNIIFLIISLIIIYINT